ncbi:hypothetical protein KP509_16G079600 [Ceratopteris richardii]|uniref:Guided entry of tail-anchored proteins factor 1 n=1 Tax=Ceratopteris richardii TaxID=49495 RepID=A0A8T2T128_CERRI|nr:hypothetical protein KP509_16G079600 [Ceratopteris richardii]
MGPIISFVWLLLAHLASRILASRSQSRRKLSPAERQLASEIKELRREADSLTTPTTFARAAKLKRVAAAKERELLQLRQTDGKKQNQLFFYFVSAPNLLQVSVYLILAYWYWGDILSSLPVRTVYPLGNTIFRNNFNNEDSATVKVGIIPWLVLCSRVSVFLARKVIP